MKTLLGSFDVTIWISIENFKKYVYYKLVYFQLKIYLNNVEKYKFCDTII